MASTDARIRHEARLYEDEVNAAKRRRLDRLRRLLDDELTNMRGRCESADATINRKNWREKAALWLHTKTFDQTYRDWGMRSSRARTRLRIEALLRLCGGDKELFLAEYTLALNSKFPIPSRSYAWAPRLVRSDSGRVTVVHQWSRVKNVLPENKE